MTVRRRLLLAARWVVCWTLLFSAVLHAADYADADRKTCGHIAPLAVYRFHQHWRPVLGPAIGTVAVVLLALTAGATLMQARTDAAVGGSLPATNVNGRHPAARRAAPGLLRLPQVVGRLDPPALARAAVYLLLVYLAALVAAGTVPTAYPTCRMVIPSSSLSATSGAVAAALAQSPANALYAGLPVSPPYPDLDVMLAAIKPTCINRLAITTLLARLSPRRVIVVTPSRHCAQFEAYDARVRCVPEETVAPGLNVPALARYLRNRGVATAHGPTRAGWYMQQFCKLLFWQRVPDLSSHFLIWDSDMIMTPAFRLFNTRGQMRQHSGGIFVSHHAAGYYAATGEPMLFGPRWESFVVHHLVVYRPYLDELLAALGYDAKRAAHEPEHALQWALQFLDRVPDEDMHEGLTEYGSYVSWVLTHHRSDIEVVQPHLWLRDVTSTTMEPHRQNHCCPKTQRVEAFTARHPELEYFGFELGHIEQCHFDAEEYKDGYFPVG